MENIEIEVIADRFTKQEKPIGVVVLSGREYDYSDIDSAYVNKVRAVLESPVEEAVGFSSKDGYGVHSVVRETRKPFTIEHILAVSNHRRANDRLFFRCDFVKLMQILHTQEIEQN